ncbi:MAG: demethylmenaquinone methyltransferase / 2-methoxy-6-polyprenyl,4-benzoquinol methylase [Gaiellales bacterium]|nr:demethylmenaquinone methyltransferase / 2-methoxy-6-polyprenyl,4-benzoquinol methylase [Gaiellales bacterium]
MTLQPERVREMFDRISPSYDRMNRLMSMGLDGRWRRLGVRMSGAVPGDAALDVCCGTGDFAVELRRTVGPSGRVVGLDFAPEMLAVARAKSPVVDWIEGDALALPFADNEFAATTVGFGVRNLSDLERGFAEMARVVRPGGRVVCLELTTPPAPIRPFSQLWTDRGVPVLGRLVAGDAAAYAYLPESVHRFPPAGELAEIMRGAGLEGVTYRRLMLGVVAIHVGTVPA